MFAALRLMFLSSKLRIFNPKSSEKPGGRIVRPENAWYCGSVKERMACMASERQGKEETTYIIQCSADNFEQAAYLSAVFSDVISVNDQSYRLQISKVTDSLRKQFEKLGASIKEAAGRLPVRGGGACTAL
jgi:hypothetical protein